MNDTQSAAFFLQKWKSSMHWAYNDMAECVHVWKRWGINGLPKHTPGAEALLSDALARDAEFHDKLRAM